MSQAFMRELLDRLLDTTRECSDERRRADRLADKLDNMVPSPACSPQQLQAFIDAVAQGRKIEAIKTHRLMTGMGLKESKDQVERIWGGAPPYVPRARLLRRA
jgi:hypothetical protein